MGVAAWKPVGLSGWVFCCCWGLIAEEVCDRAGEAMELDGGVWDV